MGVAIILAALETIKIPESANATIKTVPKTIVITGAIRQCAVLDFHVALGIYLLNKQPNPNKIAKYIG